MHKLLLIITLPLFLYCSVSYGQAPTEAQAKAMAERIRGMSPQQMMQFRDSLTNALLKKEAKVLPNGDQLLRKHHYDTTYTTVTFKYNYKSSTSGANNGSLSTSCSGTSAKAPMMYEADGHCEVQCAMLGEKEVNTSEMDQQARKLDATQPYMTLQQQRDANNISRQMAFSSMMVKDNSIKASATYIDISKNIVRKLKSLDNVHVSFSYDPVQNISTIVVGGAVTVLNVAAHPPKEEKAGIGVIACTDPSKAKIAGAPQQKADPDETYAVVTKTSRGFHIKYTRIKQIKSDHSQSDEMVTLEVEIGEPLQEYEAIITPYKCNYETWLPKGPNVDGSDDKKGDDSMRFNVVVRDKSHTNKNYAGNYTVKFALKDVTRYPGFCSNYPTLDNAPNKDPDLKLSDSLKTDENFDASTVTTMVATSAPNKGNLATIRIFCNDYGAWGKLTAEVKLDNGAVLTAHPYYNNNSSFITIPYDKDENKIADAWEKANSIFGKVYPLEWDEDVKPDNKHNGDNIPLIDEYRGFLVEDDDYKPVHTRLSANDKELFSIAQTNKTNNIKVYKNAIKKGTLCYTKATDVKVFHFTDEKYGEKEGSHTEYGTWVNYNSPLNIKTHGVSIYAYDVPNPGGASDKDKRQSMASTGAISAVADKSGYTGAQVPDDTKSVYLWIYDLEHYNDFTAMAPKWYLPARPQGHDNWNQTANKHVMHANNIFHVHMDTLHLSDIVKPRSLKNLSIMVSYIVSHELCHATNVHHHHLSEGDAGSYIGVSTCPVRYWMDATTDTDWADWVPMFLSGNWDPTTMATPYSPYDRIRLCTKDDNCFSQLKLKR